MYIQLEVTYILVDFFNSIRFNALVRAMRAETWRAYIRSTGALLASRSTCAWREETNGINSIRLESMNRIGSNWIEL